MANSDALIVDDEEDVREVCQMYLENMGCFRNILTSEDGASAAVFLGNQSFGVVLLDLNMPKRSGIQLLRQFKDMRNTPIEKVIIISGELNKDVLQEALQLGVKHFVVKPFDESSFQQKVLAILKS